MQNIRALNSEQKEAFKSLQKFLAHSAADTFVLKGYAGTGKTFLMQQLGVWLKQQEISFTMLASTGRAATVLRGKTGFSTKTVHSELYHFSKVEGINDELQDDVPMDKHGQMTLQFLLRQPDDSKKIYIIDESSMLSSEFLEHPSFASFGSGALLIDFFEAVGSNKVIFVGDPCQLPPIGQASSPALDMDWLAQQKRTAVSITLEKIERSDPGNDILVLANAIRNMSLEKTDIRFPKLPAKHLKNVTLHISSKALFTSYLEKYKEIGCNGTLAIARTNKMVGQINRALRRDLFGGIDMPLQVGDVLIVNQNNYAVPLTNGDFIIVVEIGETKTIGTLYFQKVKVKAVASETDYELLLSLNILYGKVGNFSEEETKALMVDFNRRMKRKNINGNSEAYKEAMMKDPYLNCIRASYGYAVTCHKAQGGEWDEVFLFLEKGMYRMEHGELCRWWYTAVTRARKELHLVNEWWIV
jgi:ATP-dependent exoDNAse (exonuclease V) alpha subunit